MKPDLPLPPLPDRNKMKRRWPLLVFFVILVLFWSVNILFPF